MTDAPIDFRESEIAKLSLVIVETLAQQQSEIDVKIAALRSAAECLQQAVHARTLTALMAQTLFPKGR